MKKPRVLRKDRHLKIKVAYIMELPQEKQTQLREILCEIKKFHNALT